mmetsp:Transcript_43625/g.91746  ORF Transcript_43625/g.91746 Transcript_43625/m.91746 type:complete len:332 (+) Transcript_43625:3091-4086(+)
MNGTDDTHGAATEEGWFNKTNGRLGCCGGSWSGGSSVGIGFGFIGISIISCSRLSLFQYCCFPDKLGRNRTTRSIDNLLHHVKQQNIAGAYPASDLAPGAADGERSTGVHVRMEHYVSHFLRSFLSCGIFGRIHVNWFCKSDIAHDLWNAHVASAATTLTAIHPPTIVPPAKWFRNGGQWTFDDRSSYSFGYGVFEFDGTLGQWFDLPRAEALASASLLATTASASSKLRFVDPRILLSPIRLLLILLLILLILLLLFKNVGNMKINLLFPARALQKSKVALVAHHPSPFQFGLFQQCRLSLGARSFAFRPNQRDVSRVLFGGALFRHEVE